MKRTTPLMKRNAIRQAADLLMTAYNEQDELNGPWYVSVAKWLKDNRGVDTIDDPKARGRDANGNYLARQ